MRLSPCLLFFTLLGSLTAEAAAPFISDDPDSGEPFTKEIFLYTNVNHTDVEKETPYLNAPAFEVDLGVLEDLQMHVVMPYSWETTSFNSPHGLGDLEVGGKYRFIHETDRMPQISFAPEVYLPTGDEHKGIGNGRLWMMLPFWIQKSFGPWTTYGGGGYALNSAPGLRNYPFAGWVTQRDITDKFTLGVELYTQGAVSDEGAASTIMDLGCYFNVTQQLSIMFSAGGSIFGQARTVGYLGIHWVSEQ